MSNTEWLKLTKENLERVNKIFNAVDFGKVCMTAELTTDMNDFYVKSQEAIQSAE